MNFVKWFGRNIVTVIGFFVSSGLITLVFIKAVLAPAGWESVAWTLVLLAGLAPMARLIVWLDQWSGGVPWGVKQ